MMPNHSSRRAFTLVELLVVIAIIALLAGLLIAVIGNVLRSARNTQDQSRLRGLAQAANTYASSNKGRLPSPRTDTPGGWSTMPANTDGTGVRDDASNVYKGWVCADDAVCPGSTDGCRETSLALERGSLFPYVDGSIAYLSALDNTTRIRSFSQNAWVGVRYCDDYYPLLGKMAGCSTYPDASKLAFDTRTLSRIPQPSNTMLYIPDNDPFKRTATCPGWNFNGFVVNPNPGCKTVWFDVPATFVVPTTQINVAFCDGSTTGYQVQSSKLRKGEIRGDPVNGYADFTQETLGDLLWLRDIALPSLIK